MGIVTWASLRCELLPKVEEPFFVGSADLNRLFELVHWLIRMRMVNECLVLNNVNLAALVAKKWPADYLDIKESLPPWVLFFNVAGYDYFPEERVSSQLKGISDLTNRIGLEAERAMGRVSAAEMLKTVQRPSAEPYWKLLCKGACQDIFFITTYDKLEGQISVMYELANEFGYPATDIGVYLQPIVQGTNCHCEFNLFYDPQNPTELDRVEELASFAITSLMATGAYFSRPYDKSARLIVNRDAAYVEALTRVKEIVDPNRVMNPGKLCF
jgi:hypothetical protein